MERYYVVIREFYLLGISVCYTLSFASLIGQVPGLYGDNGILPINAAVRKDDLISKLGQNGPISVELLCICGIIMGFAGVVTSDQRNKVLFGLLWLTHFCIIQVGQVLVQNVGDSLLTKMGLLAILIAPFDFCGLIKGRGSKEEIKKSKNFEFFISLARWLLFKIHFAPAIYQLLANYNENGFEVEILPNPLTWFLVQLPDWLTSYLTSQSEVISLFIAAAAIVPCKYLQKTGFIAQLFLTCYKYAIGENGLSPLLQLVLSFSLLDDQYFKPEKQKEPKSSDSPADCLKKYSVVAIAAIFVSIFRHNFNFSPASVIKFVAIISILAAVACILTLIYQLVNILKRSLDKINSILSLLYYTVTIVFILFSLVPEMSMDAEMGLVLPTEIKNWHTKATKSFKFFNDYLPFERSGPERYEVIFETSDQLDLGWVELNFKFKPSLTNQRPSIAFTHTPKLDMQMSHASKNGYQRNHWLINLAHKILTNQKEVKYLLGANPHLASAPKYIRAILYKYQFSSLQKGSESYSKSDWWIRSKVGDYLPILSADDPGLQQYIEAAKLEKDHKPVSYLTTIKIFLESKISDGCHFGIFLILVGILLMNADPATNLPTFWILFKPDSATHLSNGETLKGT